MKKIMSLAVIAAISLGFSGCGGGGVYMVQSPLMSKNKHAPINEKKGMGIIKYEEGFKEPAYKTMYDMCQGNYKIINESEVGKSVWVYGKPGYSLAYTETTVKFECVYK